MNFLKTGIKRTAKVPVVTRSGAGREGGLITGCTVVLKDREVTGRGEGGGGGGGDGHVTQRELVTEWKGGRRPDAHV